MNDGFKNQNGPNNQNGPGVTETELSFTYFFSISLFSTHMFKVQFSATRDLELGLFGLFRRISDLNTNSYVDILHFSFFNSIYLLNMLNY